MIRHAPSIGLGLGLSLRGSGVGFTGLLDLYGGAAAAYSLRALSAGWVAGDVVEVRRSSDSTSEDFTASQIDSGAMLDFVNNSTWTSAENSTSDPYTTFTGSSLTGFSATLSSGVAFAGFGGVSGVSGQTVSVSFDIIVNAGSPGLALRKSKSLIDTSSNSINYTESGSYSANLLADDIFGFIGFSEGDSPSDFTVSNFEVTGVSGADGFVSTWYDQSGNANNATQATTTAQPKIVDAGALVTGGLDFDGVDDEFNTAVIPPSTATLIGVATWDIEVATQMIFGARDSTNERSYLAQTSSGNIALGVGPGAIGVFTATASTEYIAFGKYNSGDNDIYVNGSLIGSGASASPANTTYGYNIGSLNDAGTSSGFMDGRIRELIIYPTDESANREAIEANINKQYGIYWDGSQKSLLDYYPSSSAAYSLRALNSAYTEPLVKVRRSSDSAELDVYANFDGTLNEDAILSFCGAGDGFVSTWYDQSGQDNDATQGDASAQPKIVDAGVIITNENGNAGIKFDGIGDALLCGGMIVELSQNAAYVVALTDQAGGTGTDLGYILSEGDAVSPYSSNFILGSPDGGAALWVNSTKFGSALPSTPCLLGFEWDQVNFQARMNGTTSGSAGIAWVNAETSNSAIGNQGDGGGNGTKHIITELISWKSDQSASAAAIEKNINDIYSIY